MEWKVEVILWVKVTDGKQSSSMLESKGNLKSFGAQLIDVKHKG